MGEGDAPLDGDDVARVERTAVVVARMVWQASQHLYVDDLGPMDIIVGVASMLQRSTVVNRTVCCRVASPRSVARP